MATRLSILSVSSVRRRVASLLTLLVAGVPVFLAGCGRLRPEHHETVYVAVRQTYLHDRVAAVSNRVGQVANGQPLDVLEHGRRFLRVKTEKGEMGWIEERAVIDSAEYKSFQDLASSHKQDPVVATGSVRDDVYLHVSPGRDSQRFYLLPENDKVRLLIRASVPKQAPGARPSPPKREAQATPVKPAAPQPAKTAAVTTPSSAEPIEQPEQPEIPMEDWWLIRDAQGRVGWLLSGRVDVDVPDEVAQYAEGQRIVGAYVLTHVTDPEANVPNHQVAEYVTALSQPKAGLPFDFDQIRVFTWSVKRHRYETAYRVHPIQGFLPLRVWTQPGANGGNEPVFSFQIPSSQDIAIDPETGITKLVNPRTIVYTMRDNLVRRTGPDLAPIPTTHVPGEKAKPGKAGKKKR
ncbi:MAG TPA: hypothetical protein VKB47_05325 [Terracidiphilus sp.]|nr:hypothetical protein [Terracidiphilus sp.]